MANKLKKGDMVIVLSGKDKGKKEKVLKINTKKQMIIVEKVHVVKRHTKPTQSAKGGIFEKTMPINVSKVMLVCPACSKPTRVGFKLLKDAKKVRVCKKCHEQIDK